MYNKKMIDKKKTAITDSLKKFEIENYSFINLVDETTPSTSVLIT
jgi:hypothetical protein